MTGTKSIKNKVKSNENKEIMNKIHKIRNRVRMFLKGPNENEWKNAQSFQLTNLIKLLMAKKKEMTFPFTSKQGIKTNDTIKITKEQEGIYIDTKRNITSNFIYITLPKHEKNNNTIQKKKTSHKSTKDNSPKSKRAPSSKSKRATSSKSKSVTSTKSKK